MNAKKSDRAIAKSGDLCLAKAEVFGSVGTIDRIVDGDGQTNHLS